MGQTKKRLGSKFVKLYCNKLMIGAYMCVLKNGEEYNLDWVVGTPYLLVIDFYFDFQFLYICTFLYV